MGGSYAISSINFLVGRRGHIKLEITAKFEGLDSDQHQLPAIEAGESLTGIGRSLVIMSNYLAEGRIRKRAPYPHLARVYLQPLRPGSLDAIFQVVIDPQYLLTIGEWAGSAIVGGLALSMFNRVFNRAVGEKIVAEDNELSKLFDGRSGDLDALVDAIEPALKEAHRPINIGAINININSGTQKIVQFNPATKRYVETKIRSPDFEDVELSTASYNANTRYGRVFDFSLGRTVAFTLAKDTEPESVRVVTESLQTYATTGRSRFTATLRRTQALDGRDQHYYIISARKFTPSIGSSVDKE